MSKGNSSGLASVTTCISVHVLFVPLGGVMWRRGVWTTTLREVKYLAQNKPARKLLGSVLLNYCPTASHSASWRDRWQPWEWRNDQGSGRPNSWSKSHMGNTEGRKERKGWASRFWGAAIGLRLSCESSLLLGSETGHKDHTHTRGNLCRARACYLSIEVKHADYSSGGQLSPRFTLCQMGLLYWWWKSRQVLSNWEEFRYVFTGLSFLLPSPSFFF